MTRKTGGFTRALPVLRRHLPSRRTAGAFLLLGYLPLTVLTYSSLILSERAVLSEVNARVSSFATSASTNAAGVLDSLEVTLAAFAADPPFVAAMKAGGAGSGAELVKRLAVLRASRREFSSVFLADPGGRLTAVLPASPEVIGRDFSYRDWYRGAMASQRPYVSESYETAILGGPRVVALAVAVREPASAGPDRILGIAAALYNLDSLQGVADQFAQSQGVRITVTDQTGVVLAAPGALRTGLVSLRADPRVKAALRGTAGVRSVTDGPAPMLSAYLPVPRLGWTVIAEVPKATAYARLRRLRQTVTTVAGLLAVALTAMLTLSARAEHRRRDVERKLAEQAAALAISERQFRAAFTHAPVGMLRLSDERLILEANLAFHKLLGVAGGELVGRSLDDLSHPEDVSATTRRLHRLIGGGAGAGASTVQVETRFVHRDGHPVWTVLSAARLEDYDHFPYTLGQVVDITDRKINEARLARQALHDPLTDLPNRLLLEERVNHALARLAREPQRMAVLFIDLDGFKTVNDTFGHKAGDEVLGEVATRLGFVVRPGDTVARLGGDEFVVLCEDLPEHAIDVAAALASRIIQAISHPFRHGDHQVLLSASIGISQPTPATTNAAVLLAEADAAMYRAKQEGKACHRIFDETMRDLASTPSTTLELLDSAVVQGRLRLHYQPVVDLTSGQVVGAEALLRLIGPDGELIPPAGFLTVAEAHGHIVEFGAWALREACRQAAAWKATLPKDRDFDIGVNMSVKEIEDSGMADRVRAVLIETGLPPATLIIELTESAFLRDLPASRSALQRLRKLGVRIALDDFGTGYSSLSYLRQVPVDIIKLDRSFVSDLLGDAQESRVTRALIELAHNLGTVVVAEGVEELSQVAALREQGCRLAQGYFMARPVESQHFMALLDRELLTPAAAADFRPL